MKYLKNPDEATSVEQNQRIVENIRNWLSINKPEALDIEGNLKGRDAKGNFVETGVTSTWSNSIKLADGSWVIPYPEIERFITKEGNEGVPHSVVVDGLIGEVVEDPEFSEEDGA